jgi:cytosine/adenosine deaminase-related metal-dependent hydrolase
MYSREELAFQKSYAFANLVRNGITTALPIASLFYRAWGETVQEFEDAAHAAAALGLRVYLGPAYRTGNQVVSAQGVIGTYYDEPRGLAELDAAIGFARRIEGSAGGLIRAMLAPDRVETCTPELLRRTAAASRELDIPVRQHCCQSKIEYDLVLQQHGMSPPEWLAKPGLPVAAQSAAAWHGGLRFAPWSSGPGATWTSSGTPVRASCTARWCPGATAAPSTTSRVTAPWACRSAWARTRHHPT